jgi:hypothetical protein
MTVTMSLLQTKYIKETVGKYLKKFILPEKQTIFITKGELVKIKIQNHNFECQI